MPVGLDLCHKYQGTRISFGSARVMSRQHWFLGGCVYCGILLIYLAGVNLVAWGSLQYNDRLFRHGCFRSQGEMVMRLYYPVDGTPMLV